MFSARSFVVVIDGVEIPNALNRATRIGFGHGQNLMPYMIARNVEAKPTKFRVRGAFLSKAPIEALVREVRGRNQTVEGEITFAPREGRIYRLNGTLSPRGSAIWIEDFETGQIVSETIRSSD